MPTLFTLFKNKNLSVPILLNKQKTCIDDQQLEFCCSGSGRPTIVLINGAGGPMESWYKIFPQLESIGTVFAHNRPGIGGSSKPRLPQTGDIVVAMLRVLLMHVRLKPPYLLVGHSLGGLYANLFCRLFPEEVIGVVMLDATTPQDVIEIPKMRGAIQAMLEKSLDSLFKKHENDEVVYVNKTIDLIYSANAFPDIPLVVVSGVKPSWLMSSKVEEIRAHNQKVLATLSTQGKQVIAARSGHFPQFSEPYLVIEAICDVIANSQKL